MNLDDNPTKEQLADLLRPCDDRAGHHVLWVDRAGDVRITPLAGRDLAGFVEAHPELKLWLREFPPGETFVGPGAAEDVGWVEDLFYALTQEWPKARGRAEVVAVEDW